MKTTMFGSMCFAIVCITMVIVCTICNTHARSVNLQDNLQEALESSLHTVMNRRGYDIGDTNQMVADLMEGIAMYIDNNSSLDVTVRAADPEKGIVSVEVTEHYVNSDGTVTDITCDKTVIMEYHDIYMADKFVSEFQYPDGSLYKSYTLTEGSNLLAPATPGNRNGLSFRYWNCYDTSNRLIQSRASDSWIMSHKADRDYVFKAVYY